VLSETPDYTSALRTGNTPNTHAALATTELRTIAGAEHVALILAGGLLALGGTVTTTARRQIQRVATVALAAELDAREREAAVRTRRDAGPLAHGRGAAEAELGQQARGRGRVRVAADVAVAEQRALRAGHGDRGVAEHVQPAAAAAGLGRGAGAGHVAAGRVECRGWGCGQERRAVAFASVFDAGEGEAVRAAEALACRDAHAVGRRGERRQ